MSDIQCIVEYRDVQGYPGYRVGNDGSVWTCWHQVSPNKSGRCTGGRWETGTVWNRLKFRPSRTGYPRVALYRDGKQSVFAVHHLVLTAFVGPRPDGLLALHRDDKKQNNNVENLYWGTVADNMADRGRNTGNYHYKRGMAHYKARITEEIVVQIRQLAESGMGRPAIAAKYGITYAMVCQIVTGQTWKHVAV